MRDFFTKHQLFFVVGVVGVLGVLIQTVTLAVLVEVFKIHPVLANMLACEVAIVSNFLCNNYWTFKNKSTHALLKRFALFNGSVLGSVAIQTVFVWVGMRLFGPSGYVFYALCGIGIGLILNYTIYTRFIWKSHIQKV